MKSSDRPATAELLIATRRYVTVRKRARMGSMGQSNAERQRRYRARQQALVKANPELAELELKRAAEESEGLSDAERWALADKLADAAMRHQYRATALAQLAMKVRERVSRGSK